MDVIILRTAEEGKLRLPLRYPLENQNTSCGNTVTTTYAYDVLNRLESKTYSDGTLKAAFQYDGTHVSFNGQNFNLSNTLGRLTLTNMSNWPATQITDAYSYDAMGRIANYYQVNNSNVWGLQYNYDLAGDILSWTHPAGFQINNSIRNDRRIGSVTSSLSDQYHPATLATLTYTPFGAVQTLQNGCVGSSCVQVEETYGYNQRMQLSLAEFSNMQLNGSSASTCWMYNYYPGGSYNGNCSLPTPGATGNNGNVRGYNYLDTAYPSMAHPATFGYDGVNRLVSVISGTGSGSMLNYTIGYQYDAYGNMTCTSSNSGAPCPQVSYSGNNQVTGYTYDAAGNVMNDGTNTYQWDAEGRLVSVGGVAGQACQSTWTSCLNYNAHGWVVQRSGSAGYSQAYAYDPQGGELGTYDVGVGSWLNQDISVNGRIFANYEGTNLTWFRHSNVLGSTNVITDYTGTVQQDLLFYPWGQQLASEGTSLDLHFAGFQENYPDPTIYPTPARLYPPGESRWMTPDPEGLAAADPSDPQTWNMYAYAGNNPTTNTDPTGETYHVCQIGANGEQTNCTDISDEQFDQFQQENKDTLTFTGNGNVLQNGTLIGSYNQTSIDPTAGLLAVGAGTQTAKGGIITGAIMIGVFATAYASTYAIPAVIAGLTALGDTGAVGSGAGLLNTINHIFNNPDHNLSGLVQQFGSPAAAYAALEQATIAQVVAKGLTGQFKEVVNVGGTDVIVKGKVIDGVVRIATAYR